jgi:hypothetical protein
VAAAPLPPIFGCAIAPHPRSQYSLFQFTFILNILGSLPYLFLWNQRTYSCAVSPIKNNLCNLNLKVAFRGRLRGFQCTSTEGIDWVDPSPFHLLLHLCCSYLHRAYFSATCPSPGRVTVPPAIDLSDLTLLL